MREIKLNGYIDEQEFFGDEITPEKLHNLLYGEHGEQSDDVHIVLNSYGGSCNAAVRMADDMQRYPGNVNITVVGTAASAAMVLCMAANRLDMTPGSLMMIHNPATSAYGDVEELKNTISVLETVKESILNIYEYRIKVTRDEASDMMDKTTWMDAKEALEKGFTDAVLPMPERDGKVENCVTLEAAKHAVDAWNKRKLNMPEAMNETGKEQSNTNNSNNLVNVADTDTRLAKLKY